MFFLDSPCFVIASTFFLRLFSGGGGGDTFSQSSSSSLSVLYYSPHRMNRHGLIWKIQELSLCSQFKQRYIFRTHFFRPPIRICFPFLTRLTWERPTSDTFYYWSICFFLTFWSQSYSIPARVDALLSSTTNGKQDMRCLKDIPKDRNTFVLNIYLFFYFKRGSLRAKRNKRTVIAFLVLTLSISSSFHVVRLQLIQPCWLHIIYVMNVIMTI